MENQNNLVKTFTKDGIGEVRTKIINNEPWFCAKDVCSILEIAKSRNAVSRLDDEERAHFKVYTLGGNQDMNFVSESGLYNLVFTSNKPEAKVFKKWITSEVLPMIRKNGGYVQQNMEEIFMNEYFPNLTDETKKAMLTDMQNQNKKLQEENKLAQQAFLTKKKEKQKEASAKGAYIADRNRQKKKAEDLQEKVEDLQEQIEASRNYAATLAVAKLNGVKDYDFHPLKQYCINNNLEIKKFICPGFGTRNLYPAEAWENAYNIDLKKLF